MYRVGDVETVQLFDLENDPLELVNLADRPSTAAQRRRLEALLEKTRTELDDPTKSNIYGD